MIKDSFANKQKKKKLPTNKREKKKKRTSLKRIILGCFNDLWFIISRCTCSSICHQSQKIEGSFFLSNRTEPNQEKSQVKKEPAEFTKSTNLLASFNKLNSKELFCPSLSHKLGYTKVTRSNVLNNLILFHNSTKSQEPTFTFLSMQ